MIAFICRCWSLFLKTLNFWVMNEFNEPWVFVCSGIYAGRMLIYSIVFLGRVFTGLGSQGVDDDCLT